MCVKYRNTQCIVLGLRYDLPPYPYAMLRRDEYWLRVQFAPIYPIIFMLHISNISIAAVCSLQERPPATFARRGSKFINLDSFRR